MDGWVTIGTKVDNKQLEKDLRNAETRLRQFEREADKLSTAKSKVELDLQDFEKEKQLIKESTDEMLQQAQTSEQVENVLSMETRELESLNNKYSTQFQKLDDINKKIQENAHNQSLVKNEIQETNSKLNQVKGFESIKQSISSVGNSVENVTKKVGRWALAVFGVRSAYNFVRQSISTLSQYNDQMAVNIEWIRYLLASTLQPVIEGLIQLVYKLLTYINYIAQAWFGVNLFANASTKAFEKQNKALGGSAKKAKELEKTIAGFDEMNVLQENGNVGSGGGGTGGASLPDFPKMEDVPIPKWIQWIADHKDLVIAGILGIAAALVILKMGLGGIMAIGIGIAIAGIVLLIQDIIDFLKNPSWDGFLKILRDVAMVVAGIAIAFGAWPVAIIAAVALIVIEIIRHWDQVKEVLGNVGSWIYDHIIKPVVDFFVGLHNKIQAGLLALWNYAKGIIVGIASWVYNTSIKPIAEFFVSFQEGVKSGIKATFDFVKNLFNSVVTFFRNGVSSILNLFRDLGANAGNVVASAFRGVVNGILGAVESILNSPIRAINGLIGVINKIPGVKLGKLSTFNLPRLAKGGIVNMPGKGVPIGGAIVGERGQEGVIPLTDSQQMALLGEAIGRYVNINATVPVYVGNRQITKEIRKINAEDDFAYNR